MISYFGTAKLFPHNAKAFKQLQFQDNVEIPKQKPDVEQIVSVYVDLSITCTSIVETATGQSYEGQVLTGKKLIVEGRINRKIEYVGDSEIQPVHIAHFSTPFSSFIVLGSDLCCYSDFQVDCYVEDTFVKLLSKRTIFENILFLIKATPISMV